MTIQVIFYYTLLNHCFVVLFGTNLSNEMFEFAKANKATTKDLKALLIRNVDAIFAPDQETKDWVRVKIEKFTI